jgi:peroxiredoxin
MKKTLVTMLAAFLLLASFKPEGGVKVGEKATDFKLKNVDGKIISLSSNYKDSKGVIVVFTCNHCPFAKKYEDRIIALDKKYKALGYPVVAINPNDPAVEGEDSYENMQKRATAKAYGFPYLFDETQTTAHAYGATKTPHVFILQRTGADFTVKYIGAIDDNSDDATAVKEKYAENAVDALLAGKPVATTNTKAVGCGIKWKAKS